MTEAGASVGCDEHIDLLRKAAPRSTECYPLIIAMLQQPLELSGGL